MKLWCGVLLALGFAACAGPSEERVAAVEAQLVELRKQEDEIRDLRNWIAKLEARHKEDLAKLKELDPEGEDAKANEQISRSPATPDGCAPGPWAMLHAAFGDGGVDEEEGVYRVEASWLAFHANSLALDKGGLKLKPGKEGGVTLLGVKSGSFLYTLGFRQRDVVTAINGRSVGSVEDAIAALQDSSGSAKVTLKRRRKEMTLSYEIIE